MSSSGVAAVVVVVVVLALVSACVSADCFSYSAEKVGWCLLLVVLENALGRPVSVSALCPLSLSHTHIHTHTLSS